MMAIDLNRLVADTMVSIDEIASKEISLPDKDATFDQQQMTLLVLHVRLLALGVLAIAPTLVAENNKRMMEVVRNKIQN